MQARRFPVKRNFGRKKTTAMPWLPSLWPRSRLGCAALFNVFRPFSVRAIGCAAVLARLLRGRILRVVDVLSALIRILLVGVALVPRVVLLLSRVLLVPFSFVSHDCAS